MDPVFASEKLSVGPLFHALRLSDANHMFEVFGLAFERYVCDLLERTFPKTAGLVTPMARNVVGRDRCGQQFEIDACLNYVTDLVLFEIKAVWGRESDLTPQNSDALLNLLRKRLSVTEDSVKGVGQLARVVNVFIKNQWFGPMNEFKAVRTVFPVVVVHDRLSGSPGFGNFILNEFREVLDPQIEARKSQFTCGDLRIFGPVVLTVEDLELLEVSVERCGIRDILVEYDTWSPDRMSPFSAFLVEISASGRVYANRALAAASIDVLNRAKERLFGTSCASVSGFSV